jgi:acylglycerol lipase
MIFESKTVSTHDGLNLHVEIKETGAPIWLIVTHGIAEHLKRMQFLVDYFSGPYNLCFYDLRGHGKSEGKRTYVEDFDDYLRDLGKIIQFLRINYRAYNYVLYGHSMGGLITARYVQRLRSEDFYPEKVVLSAPFIREGGLLGKLIQTNKWLTNKLAAMPYGLPIKGVVDVQKLSHDSRVIEEYVADKLVSDSLHSRLIFQLGAAANETFSAPLNCRCPLLVFFGSEDAVNDGEVLKKYFREVEGGSIVKEIKGAYHETHNEIARFRDQAIEILKGFLL